METTLAFLTTVIVLTFSFTALAHWMETALTRLGLVVVLSVGLLAILSLLYLKLEGIIR